MVIFFKLKMPKDIEILTEICNILDFSGIPPLPPSCGEYQGLWGLPVIKVYLSILDNGSNPVTVEAAAGAIQNLTACFWSVSILIKV